MKKQRNLSERYSIIICSQTDARRRSIVFSITQRTLIVSLCVVFLFLMLSAGVTVTAMQDAQQSLSLIAGLKAKSEAQAFYDGCADESETCPGAEAPELSASLYGAYEQSPAQSPFSGQEELFGLEVQSVMPGFDAEETSINSADAFEEPSLEKPDDIPMTEAISSIDEQFEQIIQQKIEAVVSAEGYSDFNIANFGDYEGDSSIVNNWADVLSVYVALTMYEDRRLLTIAKDNLKLLGEIYSSMNEIMLDVVLDADLTSGRDVPTVYVSVNSLTYEEGAQLYNLDKNQLKKLELLMSADYYIYFSELLGVDVYGGMNNEEISEIIDSLPDTKGADVVRAALIRLGNPYSRSRRGTGSYVDCSYFAWWSYDQAGISLPTSSVEQAMYCYENGFAVEEADLQPGDLIFWSKKNCRCGRWNEIHHVGIYIGNGKLIEATSGKGCVAIRPVWGIDGATWKIFMYARPY